MSRRRHVTHVANGYDVRLDESAQYRSRSAIIDAPGKFEGEPRGVQSLWDQSLDGGYDDIIDRGDGRTIYSLTIGEDEDWEGVPPGARVELWEDDQGFVHHEVVERSKA